MVGCRPNGFYVTCFTLSCDISLSCFKLQGVPVGLRVQEVRDSSAVVLWDPPAFNGRTPVNGYYLDVKEASAGDEGWKAVHEKVNRNKYIKASGALNIPHLTCISMRGELVFV